MQKLNIADCIDYVLTIVPDAKITHGVFEINHHGQELVIVHYSAWETRNEPWEFECWIDEDGQLYGER